ncbi:MAG: response regulator [Candidatus Omnitrophica bacterium]|nr:response regulator [Candidatus Omnitrophota bacterium]
MKNYVLIIEDDPHDSTAVSVTLARSGINFKIAKNGMEALNLAQEETPIVIILDLMLPGLNGIKLAHLFRADSSLKNVPIVVVSALNQGLDNKLGAELGIKDYFNKPINQEDLLKAINKYL